ncbi:extracellular matrix regulator RemB [Weizmannia acidilactici]|uniref:extracellular matrix regulator RemB n=1 Tax=Weizmannia acidilactici TaxID=2607726 RepID=UPI00124C84BD|nr:extracellular matrix/biofilm biosynthesis regulator RemA family protein [Weizmannia acidilactici]GER74641.1 hypothetical protein BpPP18_27080 [Weizmannia acidilactici]
MYLHIGEDVMVRGDEIIAILDQRSLNGSDINDDYLQAFRQDTINLAKGGFKSVIITQHRIYLSPLSPGALIKRTNGKTKRLYPIRPGFYTN